MKTQTLLALALTLFPGCAAHRRAPSEIAEVLRAEDRRVADDALRRALAAEDSALRARAVRALGRMRLPTERPRLEAALSDSASPVRREAARALALLADAASVPALTNAAKDPDAEVRAGALEALGWTAGTTGSAAVRAGLSDPDPRVVRAAALAVWRLSDGLQAVEALAAAGRSGTQDVRRAAAYALARMAAAGMGPASSGATPPVPNDAQRAALRDALLLFAAHADPELRMQVARGLAHPGRPSEEQALGALATDKESRVRVHAARSSTWEGGPSGPIGTTLERLLQDDDPLVAQTAIEGLGRVKSEHAKQRLQGIVQIQKPEWLAAVALDTLDSFDSLAGGTAALPLFETPSPRLRAAAARASLAMPDTLLADPDLGVRTAAIAALATADPFDPRLAPFASGDDPIVRASLAEALGAKLDGEERMEALAGLEELWQSSKADQVPDARDTVLDAAGKAGRDPAVRKLLDAGLSDPDWLVRKRAAEVLKRVYEENHDSSVGAASDRPVSHYAEVLRWAAMPHRAVFRLEGATFEADLACEQAPLTCVNFACLANAKFYDGHQVHRVVPSFVIQDGDPRGDGSGGPGYAIRDEVGMAFGPGVLGMASAGYDTPGSQWFVTSAAQPHLDLRYTAFGTVTKGFGAVPRIHVETRVLSIRVDGGATGAPCPPELPRKNE